MWLGSFLSNAVILVCVHLMFSLFYFFKDRRSSTIFVNIGIAFIPLCWMRSLSSKARSACIMHAWWKEQPKGLIDKEDAYGNLEEWSLWLEPKSSSDTFPDDKRTIFFLQFSFTMFLPTFKTQRLVIVSPATFSIQLRRRFNKNFKRDREISRDVSGKIKGNKWALPHVTNATLTQ